MCCPALQVGTEAKVEDVVAQCVALSAECAANEESKIAFDNKPEADGAPRGRSPDL